MPAKRRSAADYVPNASTLKGLRAAAARCRGCDLYKAATQTVFGDGAARARVMFVGEQPGDHEDKEGRTFVGPAGKFLRALLREAGIAESRVYFTNAVKHFKYIWRGKHRIHSKPKRLEVQACRPWLEAEIALIRPEVIVTLGATASQALMGPSFRLTKHRGEFLPSPHAAHVMAMIHPSAILRTPAAAARAEETARFLSELRIVARTLRDRPKRKTSNR